MRTTTFRPRLVIGFLLLTGATLWAASFSQIAPRTPASDLPPELAVVPPDAMYFFYIQTDRIEAHPVMQSLKKHLPPDVYQELEKESLKDVGLSSLDMSRFTMFLKMTAPLGNDNFSGMVVVTKKPVDRQHLLKANVPNAEEKKAGDKTYYASKDNDRGKKLHFMDERSVLLMDILGMPGDGDSKATEKFLLNCYKKKEKGPLSEIITEAKDKLLVMGVHIPEDFRKAIGQFGGLPGEYSWVEPLMQMQVASLTMDLDTVSKIHVRLYFPDAGKAKDAEDAVQHGLKFFKEQLEGPIAEMQEKAKKTKNSDDPAHPGLKLLREIETTLKTAQVRVEDKILIVTLSVKTDDAVMEQVAKFFIAQRQKEKRTEREQANLKQIGVAMHDYHSDLGFLPSPAICDKNGKPLLSWRVAMLPYLGQQELHKQFKLDEPWDSDHNKKLLAKMPAVYRSQVATDPDSQFKTYYKVFVSKKGDKPAAAFIENEKMTVAKISVEDGTSNTIMAIEGGEPVPWTKPEDIPFDVNKPLPNLDQYYPNGWHAVFCDGSVRKIKKGAVEKLLKQLITYNGGEADDTSSIFADDD